MILDCLHSAKSRKLTLIMVARRPYCISWISYGPHSSIGSPDQRLRHPGSSGMSAVCSNASDRAMQSKRATKKKVFNGPTHHARMCGCGCLGVERHDDRCIGSPHWPSWLARARGADRPGVDRSGRRAAHLGPTGLCLRRRMLHPPRADPDSGGLAVASSRGVLLNGSKNADAEQGRERTSGSKLGLVKK
jgi:hypothetical protein